MLEGKLEVKTAKRKTGINHLEIKLKLALYCEKNQDNT